MSTAMISQIKTYRDAVRVLVSDPRGLCLALFCVSDVDFFPEK